MTTPVAQARVFAVAAHGEQRYGDQPYSVHLDAVAATLAPFGEEAQVVGYLHDVVEDTAVSLETIRAEFGERVAKLVSLVTDEPGANRRDRKARSNAKLAAVSGEDVLALVVKAADRLANLRAAAGGGAESKLGMYRREHPDFRRAAYRPGLCDDLWQEIDAVIEPNGNATRGTMHDAPPENVPCPN
jgi:(p)ppGpp synthase/HD superfamily hydrolase